VASLRSAAARLALLYFAALHSRRTATFVLVARYLSICAEKKRCAAISLSLVSQRGANASLTKPCNIRRAATASHTHFFFEKSRPQGAWALRAIAGFVC